MKKKLTAFMLPAFIVAGSLSACTPKVTIPLQQVGQSTKKKATIEESQMPNGYMRTYKYSDLNIVDTMLTQYFEKDTSSSNTALQFQSLKISLNKSHSWEVKFERVHGSTITIVNKQNEYYQVPNEIDSRAEAWSILRLEGISYTGEVLGVASYDCDLFVTDSYHNMISPFQGYINSEATEKTNIYPIQNGHYIYIKLPRIYETSANQSDYGSLIFADALSLNRSKISWDQILTGFRDKATLSTYVSDAWWYEDPLTDELYDAYYTGHIKKHYPVIATSDVAYPTTIYGRHNDRNTYDINQLLSMFQSDSDEEVKLYSSPAKFVKGLNEVVLESYSTDEDLPASDYNTRHKFIYEALEDFPNAFAITRDKLNDEDDEAFNIATNPANLLDKDDVITMLKTCCYLFSSTANTIQDVNIDSYTNLKGKSGSYGCSVTYTISGSFEFTYDFKIFSSPHVAYSEPFKTFNEKTSDWFSGIGDSIATWFAGIGNGVKSWFTQMTNDLTNWLVSLLPF